MKTRVLRILLACLPALFVVGVGDVLAQRHIEDWSKKPRLEDHFFRRRVRFRIDFQEKVNRPMNQSENTKLYDEKSRIFNSLPPDQGQFKFEHRKGIIAALMDMFYDGEIVGYDPFKLDTPYMQEQFNAWFQEQTSEGGGGGGGGEAFAEGEGGEEDDFGFDDFGDEEDMGGEEEAETPGDVLQGVDTSGIGRDYSKFIKAIDVIEDRIFDKNKSAMHYDVHYIILSIVNSAMIERSAIAFKYDEVKDVVLDRCQWKNPYNDAQYKTLKEIFEFRLFNGIITELSGSGMNSVDEADKRRKQLVEYEHNLWSF